MARKNKIYPLKFVEVRHASLVVLKKSLKEEEDKDFTEIAKEEDIDVDAEELDESEVKELVEEPVEESSDDSSEVESSDEAEKK